MGGGATVHGRALNGTADRQADGGLRVARARGARNWRRWAAGKGEVVAAATTPQGADAGPCRCTECTCTAELAVRGGPTSQADAGPAGCEGNSGGGDVHRRCGDRRIGPRRNRMEYLHRPNTIVRSTDPGASARRRSGLTAGTAVAGRALGGACAGSASSAAIRSRSSLAMIVSTSKVRGPNQHWRRRARISRRWRCSSMMRGADLVIDLPGGSARCIRRAPPSRSVIAASARADPSPG